MKSRSVDDSPASEGFPRAVVKFADKNQWRVIAAVTAVYFIYFFALCLLKYRAYAYGDFDLPIFDQSVWTTAHFDGFFKCSIRFGYVFTDHLPLILLAVVPFYWAIGWLVPGALILLFLQTVALAGTAVPLYLLARREIGTVFGLVVAVTYLLYPALGYMNLFEFHPGVLAVFFLAWSFYFLRVKRWIPFVLFTVFSLMCREDVAGPVFMLGIYAVYTAWRRRERLRSWSTLKWTVFPTTTAVAYFLIAIAVVIPAFQSSPADISVSPFVRLYSYLVVDAEDFRSPSGFNAKGYREAIESVSATSIAAEVVRNPIGSIRKASKTQRKNIGLYTKHLLAPVGGLSLLAPQALVPALPAYYENLLAVKPEPTTIFYQYTANITPFVFISLIFAIAWVRRVRWIRARSVVVAVYLLSATTVTSVLWGKQFHPLRDPWGVGSIHEGKRDYLIHTYSNYIRRDQLTDSKDEMLAELKTLEASRNGGARPSVIASFDFLHRVPMRTDLYSWHYVKAGRDPVTGAVVSTPQADYAVLDFRDGLTFRAFTNPRSAALQREYLGKGGWKLRRQIDSVVLLERGGRGDLSALATVTTAPESIAGERPKLIPAGADRDLGLRLLDSRVTPVVSTAGHHVVQVVCYYAIDHRFHKKSSPFVYRTMAVFEISGPDGICYSREWPIAYTLVGPNDWPILNDTGGSGQSVRVNYPLLLPPELASGTYRVRLQIRNDTLDYTFCSVDFGPVQIGRI